MPQFAFSSFILGGTGHQKRRKPTKMMPDLDVSNRKFWGGGWWHNSGRGEGDKEQTYYL